jgi:hypothetical protein
MCCDLQTRSASNVNEIEIKLVDSFFCTSTVTSSEGDEGARSSLPYALVDVAVES